MRTWLKITGLVVGVGLAAFLVKKAGRLTVRHLERELDRQKRLTAERFAEIAPTIFVMKGFALTKDQVREHEKTLEEKPTDMQARCLLLGYYRRHSKPGSRDRKRLHAHALWIIENRPQTPMARECELLPWLEDDTVYEMGKQIWLKHCESHKTDCRILSNAANYLLLEDRLIAEQLILQGKLLQPDNPEWSDRLAHLYDLGLDGVDETQCANMALKERKAVYELSKKKYSPFHLLQLKRLPELALKAEQYDDAISDSKLLLFISWVSLDKDYASECKHEAHTILGRVALKLGDVEKAKVHLWKSACVSGSATLSSFGPNMELAKELLERGDTESVLRYLVRCEQFWTSGKERITKWRSEIMNGNIPGTW